MKKAKHGGSSSSQPPHGLEGLTELAMNLRWSWNHSADELWRRLDVELWEKTRHPSVVLQTVAQGKLNGTLADPEFCALLDRLLKEMRQACSEPAWFQQAHPQSPLTCVAYFCMEFMLTEALPIYSGGLGNVAGDQLKTTSDLGVPVVGVGLLYQHGYFRQVIDREGAQQELYPFNDPAQMPITPILRKDGEPLRLEIDLPGDSVWLRAWEAQVGRCKLYLLDSNDAANAPVHRGITSELYGGDAELRLKQEIVLGIGGWRLLVALGIEPEVCHLNEGHAAFALLERARSFGQANDQPFEVALTATRVGNVFTTHTAVAAGFDLFPPDLIEQYLGRYARDELGISIQELLSLGRRNADDASEPFNMAYLATHGSGVINGVSQLHGKVSRQIFSTLFPRWPIDEVPIGHITNGVHMPTWDSPAADKIWTDACGKDRWQGTSESLEEDLRSVSDETLWALREDSLTALVGYAREAVSCQMASVGADQATIGRTQLRLKPGVLTLGFARRFATYKRPNLLLNDPERLLRILKNAERPVQIIIAGKAHPADKAGQALIQEWTQFIRSDASPPVIFIADYDMLLAQHLVQGVDVWINTPRRPWEASGTSGMKVLVNGGINLSELDGWWAEAYSPELGWAIGDGQEHGDDAAWDALDAETLYEHLEQQVVPEFYNRNEDGIPTAWVTRMRESMATLTPQFAASRAVTEYTEHRYLPAAVAYRKRSADKGASARVIVDWRRGIEAQWPKLSLTQSKIEPSGDRYVVEVEARFAELDAGSVRVELFSNGQNGGSSKCLEMTRIRDLPDGANGGIYRATVSAECPASYYTARLVPHFEGLSLPLEAGQICWQR